MPNSHTATSVSSPSCAPTQKAAGMAGLFPMAWFRTTRFTPAASKAGWRRRPNTRG